MADKSIVCHSVIVLVRNARYKLFKEANNKQEIGGEYHVIYFHSTIYRCVGNRLCNVLPLNLTSSLALPVALFLLLVFASLIRGHFILVYLTALLLGHLHFKWITSLVYAITYHYQR